MCMTTESDMEKDPLDVFCSHMLDLHMLEIIIGMYSAIEFCDASDCSRCPFTDQECTVMRDNIDYAVVEDWLDRWAKLTGRTVPECKSILERGIGFLSRFLEELYKKPVEHPNPGGKRLEGGLDGEG